MNINIVWMHHLTWFYGLRLRRSIQPLFAPQTKNLNFLIASDMCLWLARNANNVFFVSSSISRWMVGGGNIACDLCGKQYGTTSGLRRHRMYNCPLNTEKAPERSCTYCSYTSRRPDMLRTHMNRHKNQVNFDPDETYNDDYSIFVTSSHWDPFCFIQISSCWTRIQFVLSEMCIHTIFK